MTKVQLSFTRNFPLELVELNFSHPLSGNIKSNRGSNCIPGVSKASFKWGPGMRALCLLFLRGYSEILSARREGRAVGGVSIFGEGGSLPAALDGALSKTAAWTLECFGSDSNGAPIIKRLLIRTNPERKRSGPVGIGIASSTLREIDFSVKVDGQAAADETAINNLEQCLLSEVQGRVSLITPSAINKTQPSSLVDFEPSHYLNTFLDHTILALSATNVFEADTLKDRYKELAQSPEFNYLAGSISRLFERSEAGLRTSDRLGIMNASNDYRLVHNKDAPPLRILVPGSHLPVVALLDYMVSDECFPFELDYRFSHANEIVNLLLSGQEPDSIDGCVISLGQLARLMAGRKTPRFELLTAMPAVELSVLAPAGQPGSIFHPGENIHLLKEGGSSSSILLAELTRRSKMRRKDLQSEHAEPQSFAKFLTKDCIEDRVIAWFPYSVILERLTGCSRTSLGSLGLKDNFLLLSSKLMKNQQVAVSLNVSIRNSWMRLLEDRERSRSTIERLLKDPVYTSALRRWVGWDLHQSREDLSVESVFRSSVKR